MDTVNEALHDMSYWVEQLEAKALEAATPADDDRITAAVASLTEAIAQLQPLATP